ncbi:hypothetical protein DEU56DRAFT_540738 [Suillus clintonianus]|uniref:uncharacterized protein n=1 Tax=Suillus clintonianus TaxID=1904413 RepID=UPI001B86AA9E|nr:uncharacterized protein DEU56DRAFT_540738 [Suillus clintonianus]KAG2126524.1 hypothetical protein DEU56DRAFT_540738 [Suillus clintonianus]
MLRDAQLFMPAEYRRAFSMALSPLQRTVPLLRIRVRYSAAFHRCSATLTPRPMEQPNPSNAQDGPPSLIVALVSSMFLQYRTEGHWLSLHGRGRSSKAKCTAKHRRRHRKLSLQQPRPPRHLLLQVLILPQVVKQLRSHHLSHGGLVSYFSFVVHLPHMLMGIDTACG